MHSRLDRFAMLVLVGLCAIWGLNQAAMKVGMEGVSPIMQAGLRAGGAAVLVAGWMWFRRIPLFAHDGTLWTGILSGLLFGGEFLLIFFGLAHTTASRGGVFLYLAPFVVAIGAHFLVDDEPLTRRKLAGLVAAFIGVVLAIGDDNAALPPGHLTGDLLCIGAAVMWGLTTLLVRATGLRRIAAEKTLLYQLVGSAAISLPLSLLLGEPGVFAPTPLVLGSLAFQVVIVVAISYLIWFWLMKSYPASELAAFTFLTPVFGLIFGAWMLGEPVGLKLVGALAMVAFGIVLVTRR